MPPQLYYGIRSIFCGWGVSSKGPLWVYPQLNTPIIYPVYMYWKADSLLVSQPKGGLQSSEIKYKPLPPLQTLDAPAPPTKYRPDTIVFQERNWDTVIPAITLLDLIHNWSWIDSIHMADPVTSSPEIHRSGPTRFHKWFFGSRSRIFRCSRTHIKDCLKSFAKIRPLP